VDGFLKIAQAQDVEGQTLNLGTGRDIRIADLVEQVINLAGKRVEVVIDHERLRPEKSEVQRLISDNSLALQKMGWSPQTSFEDGLRLTFEWIKDHLALYSGGHVI
jgi:dTDP-glucose 4,6-dehydratase